MTPIEGRGAELEKEVHGLEHVDLGVQGLGANLAFRSWVGEGATVVEPRSSWSDSKTPNKRLHNVPDPKGSKDPNHRVYGPKYH